MKCAGCGRKIEHAYYINGVAYGYSCYKMKLAIIYKQWEDERNAEYSAKCFSAMQIFTNKKNNSSFHESIMKQWNDCKKLTAKQLECIIKGFTFSETIEFYKVWFTLANEEIKRAISSWSVNLIFKEQIISDFLEDEAMHKIIKTNREYEGGFHFYKDVDCPKDILIMANGRYIRRKDRKNDEKYDKSFLEENQNDEYIKVLKIVE